MIECPVCAGTGYNEDRTGSCWLCGGRGWVLGDIPVESEDDDETERPAQTKVEAVEGFRGG